MQKRDSKTEDSLQLLWLCFFLSYFIVMPECDRNAKQELRLEEIERHIEQLKPEVYKDGRYRYN